MPSRECTYQDFLKYQPLSFNGTERVVGKLVGSRRWKRCSTLATVQRSRLCHELGRTYEVDDRSVLSKKQGSEDGDRVVELGCEGK
ncbi:hypothetical protein Tco_0062291 [Tanacetum coccineum]